MKFEFPTDELRTVNGFEGMYSVTNDGRVWSHKRVQLRKNGAPLTIHGKWLKRMTINKGYFYVNLYRSNGNGYERFLVHRLVALAWVENAVAERDQVNHLDGVRKNNIFTNLEWCTSKENHQHAWSSGLRSVTQKQLDAGSRAGKRSRIFDTDQVHSIRSLHRAGTCQRTIAKQFNVTPGAIHKIVHNRSYSEI
jgi:hypothetical protein